MCIFEEKSRTPPLFCFFIFLIINLKKKKKKLWLSRCDFLGTKKKKKKCPLIPPRLFSSWLSRCRNFRPDFKMFKPPPPLEKILRTPLERTLFQSDLLRTDLLPLDSQFNFPKDNIQYRIMNITVSHPIFSQCQSLK